jgi:hypothetical protein
MRSHHLQSYSRNSQSSMETEVSLPCSQEPSTGPFPEPHKSSPYQSILFQISILILSTHICLSLHSGRFPSGFTTKVLYTRFFSCVLHALPILCSLTSPF